MSRSKNNRIMGNRLGKISQEESNDLGLYIEYIQWDFINNILYKVGADMLNIREKSQQEFTNTLQRWFIYINEHFNDVPKYPYFPILPKIVTNHVAAQFLLEAFVEKKFATRERISYVVEKILEIIETRHSEVIPHNEHTSLNICYYNDRDQIEVGDFQSPLIPRLKLLIDKAGIMASAKMLLRYESFGNGSYQWGDPKEVHKVLFDKFGVRYEGFASPVNSRFIEYENTYFCSLFSDTDEIFGSLGNFFHVDMKKHIGGWSVNPPFLNDLMKEVAERIINVLDEGYEGYFFCTFPGWEDDLGWQLLNKSRHLFKRFDLKPQHFVVQDAYGKTFMPKMTMNMFVMGALPSNVSRLTELGNTLVLDSVNALPSECDW